MQQKITLTSLKFSLNISYDKLLQKRFEGTRVTVESFLAWRKQFEIEMGIPAKREKENKDKNKLTGKELFMRDTTLNESDLKFLDDGEYYEY